MKNVSKILMFIFIAGLFFTACQKEQLVQTTQKESKEIEVFFKSNFLAFKTVESYKKTIGDLSEEKTLVNLKQINQNPLRNLKKSTSLDEDLYPEFLLTILNEDKIVQIGEWIIKVDMEKNIVSVINEENYDLVDNLIEGVTNKKIYQFSTSDDVLDLLEDGSKGTVNTPQLKGIFCKEGYAADHNSHHTINVNGFLVQTQCRYYKGGIYYSLFAQVSNVPPNPYAVSRVIMNLTYGFRSRCGRGYDRPLGSNTSYDSNIPINISHDITVRVYESNTNLAWYSLSTQFNIGNNYQTETISSGL